MRTPDCGRRRNAGTCGPWTAGRVVEREAGMSPIAKDSAAEEAAVAAVEEDYAHYRELGLLFQEGENHTHYWNRQFGTGRKKLFGADGKLNRDVLRNFWGSRVFIADNPAAPLPRGPLALLGEYRGEIRVLESVRATLRECGYHRLLRKYPCPSAAGNPNLYRRGRYRYTHRWAKQVYFLGRMNDILRPHLPQGFVTLDIGSGQGLFSALVHMEYPGAHAVLVDLPEQLLLSRYFLTLNFPAARIAGVKEIRPHETLGRDFFERYDFVLLAPTLYPRAAAGSVDLITSFASLGELKRPVFEAYVSAPVFRTAKFLFTVNPVRGADMFEGADITLLDFPLASGEKCLHFGISPIFAFPYMYPKRRYVFSYEMMEFPAFFEYIGRL